MEREPMEREEIPPLTVDDIADFSSLNMAYTIGAQGSPYGTITTTAGSNGTSGQYYTNGTSVPNWSSFNIGSAGSLSNSSTLEVKGDAAFDGDIKWKGRSLGKMLESIEDRLAILQPDPAKLEKFAALKKAYDHYKLMEKLIGDDWKDKQDES